MYDFIIHMEEKYAIVKYKNEDGSSTYEIVMMDFLTPYDAINYRDENFNQPLNYIVVRYFI